MWAAALFSLLFVSLSLPAGAQAATLAPPSAMKVTGLTGDSVALSWGSVTGAASYRVIYSTNADLSAASYWRFTTNSGTVGNLKATTSYYFKVRALKADGSALTDYSAQSKATTGAAAPAPPSAMKVTGLTGDSVALSWGSVTGAASYRVIYSTNADLSAASYWRFSTNSGTVGNLKATTSYYFKVRALKADGSALTDYSTQSKATTGAAAPAPPSGVTVSFRTSVSFGLTWDKMPNASTYRVAYSTHSDMSGATYMSFSDTRADIRGLTPATTYFVQVRIINADGTNVSAYSTAVKVATDPAPVYGPVVNPLSVASYNVRCAICGGTMGTESPWTARRGAVVATITSKMPDIAGIQEASQGWLPDSPTGGLAQFEDLRNGLNATGAAYALTNQQRNNCQNSLAPTNCIPMDQGASAGTRIFYNTKTVKIVSSGTHVLPSSTTPSDQRYLVWAEAIQLSTGKHFFFADTHLEPGETEAASDLRRQQAADIVSFIKTQNVTSMPVMLVGDMNSSKWFEPSNIPYDTFTASGLVDPLGNTYKSIYPSGYDTAERTVNRNVNSWNGFEQKARQGASGTNGANIDYIFTSKMRVPTWETVANVDASGNYVGLIPSDHNMLYATVQLP